MVRRELLVGDDRWFDPDQATKWDGKIDVGCALYRTQHEGWVLYEGTYKAIEERQAVIWLLRNEHDLRAGVEDTASALEY